MQSVLDKSLPEQGYLEGLRVIITAPSLDPTQNVSGVSSVVQFIIDNNTRCEYQHFQLGKSDKETGVWNRITRIIKSYKDWKKTLPGPPCKTRPVPPCSGRVIVHYSFPLSAPSILRDPWFMWHAYKRLSGSKGIKGSSGSKRLSGLRGMVVHVHGGLFLTSPKIPFVLNRILKWVFSWDVPFIVLSEGERKTLQERFGAKRVYVLPNCPSLPNRLPQISQMDTDNSAIVLGYLGRIEPNKGMTELLEACKRLKENGVKCKLRFAGKEQTVGEYLPLFEGLNEDEGSKVQRGSKGSSGSKGLRGSKSSSGSKGWFEYVGLVSGETKDAFLRSLDLFVMPTYFEGLPMSLLESMGYGVVPVVTPVGSIPDVVKTLPGPPCSGEKTHPSPPCSGRELECENGVFVKVRDVESIVEAVTMLYNDRNLLGRLSKNAQKTILDNFSADRYVERLNEIYGAL